MDCENKDYTMLVYPLHVLATNRTCDTMISRQNKIGFRSPSDLANIRSLSGLFAGLLPYSINYVRTMWDYQYYKKEDGLFLQQRREPLWKKAKNKLEVYLPIPEKKKREDEVDKFDGYFIKHIGASVGKMACTLMLSNAINILAVRMQNVDYPNNRSFRGAVKDLFVIDKHRMFYKGLVPITIACTNLYCVTDVMHVCRNPNPLSWYGISNYVWPFIYLGGTMLVHPFMLIGMRV